MADRPITKVSLVTPSYNHAHFIRATIESVLSQDFPNLEYIVVDGASTDGTKAIVQEDSSRLQLVSRPDRGQSQAINDGFRMAKGTVLAWLNSDDILLPGAVASAVRAFEDNPGAGMVYGDGYFIDSAGEVTGRFPHTREPDLWRLVYLSDYILQQATFFRRDVLEDVGYVDESLHYGLDWDLFIRIGLKYQLAYLPKSMGCIREHLESKTASGGAGRIRELHAILRRHTGLTLPPGSIVYGLDTYTRLACAAISPLPKGVRNIVEKAIRFTAGSVVNHALLHSQGLYTDGWAGETMLYMLPAGYQSVRIEGFVPDTRLLRGQLLRVECNGMDAGRYAVGPGLFRIDVKIPQGLDGQALRFRVVARRSLADYSGFRRRIAFRLDLFCGMPQRAQLPAASTFTAGS